jgi:AraC-like DNA-binding protein
VRRVLRSQLVAPALAAVRAGGGDPAPIAARFGVALDAAETTLPLADLRALLDACAAAAGDPLFGAHLAAGLPRGTYGLLEYSCRSAPTVGAALARVARYIVLLNELVEISLDEASGTLEQRIPGEPECVGRHGNEFFVVLVLATARALAAAPIAPRAVTLAHPAHGERKELERLLGVAPRFDAGVNRVVFPDLGVPLVSADPALLALLDRQAEQGLPERPGSRFLHGVRAQVAAELAGGPPGLAEVARALRLSSRTLQRRLADAGTSLSAVVEEVRQERARALVADRAVPLGEIAFRLGYSDMAPFLRAFKRWTGRTAGQFRGGARGH